MPTFTEIYNHLATRATAVRALKAVFFFMVVPILLTLAPQFKNPLVVLTNRGLIRGVYGLVGFSSVESPFAQLSSLPRFLMISGFMFALFSFLVLARVCGPTVTLLVGVTLLFDLREQIKRRCMKERHRRWGRWLCDAAIMGLWSLHLSTFSFLREGAVAWPAFGDEVMLEEFLDGMCVWFEGGTVTWVIARAVLGRRWDGGAIRGILSSWLDYLTPPCYKLPLPFNSTRLEKFLYSIKMGGASTFDNAEENRRFEMLKEWKDSGEMTEMPGLRGKTGWDGLRREWERLYVRDAYINRLHLEGVPYAEDMWRVREWEREQERERDRRQEMRQARIAAETKSVGNVAAWGNVSLFSGQTEAGRSKASRGEGSYFNSLSDLEIKEPVD